MTTTSTSLVSHPLTKDSDAEPIQQIKKINRIGSRRKLPGGQSRLKNAGNAIVAQKDTDEHLNEMKQGESNIMVSA